MVMLNLSACSINKKFLFKILSPLTESQEIVKTPQISIQYNSSSISNASFIDVGSIVVNGSKTIDIMISNSGSGNLDISSVGSSDASLAIPNHRDGNSDS
jgi:hypothetical protein